MTAPTPTPWDTLPRDALILQVGRLHSAVISARVALSAASRLHPSPYWSPGGSGWRALEECERVLAEGEAPLE